MNIEEFRKRYQEDPHWKPGQEIINSALDAIYPQGPDDYLATMTTSKALFGGQEYLDAYALYYNDLGYKHLVTYGMTEQDYNEEYLGAEFNGWGYEMTIKLKNPKGQKEALESWPIELLSSLARYTNETGNYFEPFEYIQLEHPIRSTINPNSEIGGLIIAEDPLLARRDTIYGSTSFLQLVGINQEDMEKILANPNRAYDLVHKIKKENPQMIIDLDNM